MIFASSSTVTVFAALLSLTSANPFASANSLVRKQIQHCHVVIQTFTINAAKHEDTIPVQQPSGGFTPLTLTNVSTSNATDEKTINATMKTATGTSSCSITIPDDKDLIGEDLYPCGEENWIGFPRQGHVAVMGKVASTTRNVLGAGHGDVELDCDGDVCQQIGDAEVEIASVFTMVLASQLESA